MKKYHTLECDYDYDFIVLGINSHTKAYMLCSVCADLKISEIVDVPNYVVSCHLPKSIFD